MALLLIGSALVKCGNGEGAQWKVRSIGEPRYDAGLRAAVGLLRIAGDEGKQDPREVRIPVFGKDRETRGGASLEDVIVLKDGYFLAWVSWAELERLSGPGGISYLALAGSLCPRIADSRFSIMPEIPLAGELLRTPVLVGIVDRDFRLFLQHRPDLAKRIIAVWDRDRENGMLDSQLSAAESTWGVHGSHVAGIIDRLAPAARFVMVETRPDQAGVVSGIYFIHKMAREAGRPCVVNLSINTPVGPHDGSSLFERILSSYARDGLFLVVAAGNGWDDGQHAEFTEKDAPADVVDLQWTVAGERTGTAETSVDVWFDREIRCEAVVLDPNASEMGRACPEQSLLFWGPQSALSICNDVNDLLNHCAHVQVVVKEVGVSQRVETWTLRLAFGARQAFAGDAWMGCVPVGSSRFARGVSRRKTITSPGTAADVISVGTRVRQGGQIRFASQGPTRDQRPKPDIVLEVNQPTSYAAAYVTGCMAHMLADPRADHTRDGILRALRLKWHTNGGSDANTAAN